MQFIQRPPEINVNTSVNALFKKKDKLNSINKQAFFISGTQFQIYFHFHRSSLYKEIFQKEPIYLLGKQQHGVQK